MTLRRRFTNNRVTAAPLEGRAVLSDFDIKTGRLTHHTSSQLPHAHAGFLGQCLGLPLHKLRLVAPDIGGGFGSKLGLGTKVQQKIVRTIFKRRSGFELPVTSSGAQTVTFAEIARQTHTGQDLPLGMTPGLDETDIFDPKDILFAYGTHVAMVEVDAETGHIAMLRHVVVDDGGRIINPLLADGQVHGGAAQGIGQALMEAVVHGIGGEPLVSGFSNYAMPHANDLPTFETGRTEIRTKINPLGARGVGEGATIGATPAVVNAVLDALAPLGVTDIPMPMTPMRVWHAIEQARAKHDVKVRSRDGA